MAATKILRKHMHTVNVVQNHSYETFSTLKYAIIMKISQCDKNFQNYHNLTI